MTKENNPTSEIIIFKTADEKVCVKSIKFKTL